MPSQLEHAMENIMFTFHKFAGDKNYLTKEDLRQLMEKEVPGYMEVSEAETGLLFDYYYYYYYFSDSEFLCTLVSVTAPEAV
uniref:S100/CaBP-9k-type calcium binding subdomain domain-containing protein n=1 Tax=Podarcis muralis TaxID=64176 RepID=A0A670K8J8_PODMU